MSTFTDWNGPQGSNVRANDLLALTKAYQDMLSAFNEHTAGVPSAQNVHKIKDYVEPLLADLKTIMLSAATAESMYVKKVDADNASTGYAKKSEIPDISPLAKKSEIPDISPLAEKTAVAKDIKELADSVAEQIAELNTLLAGISKTEDGYSFEGVINAGEAVIETITVDEITLSMSKFSAYVGGSDPDGVYYLLGMLKDKAGVAFVKYADDNKMAAVVNFATYGTASLSVTATNNTLTGLKFLIVSNTDSSSDGHIYLAVQAKDWINTFTSSDGVGYHKALEFEATGINFAPVGSKEFKTPNGSGIVLASCMSGNGFSASSIATNVFTGSNGENIFKVVREGNLLHLAIADSKFNDIQLNARPVLVSADSVSPFLTAADIKSLDEVGVISGWPKYELKGNLAVPVDYPSIDLPCDGSTFDKNVYKSLYNVLGTDVLPVIDYHIIRAKSVLEIINTVNAVGGTLADAVATIHDTSVYLSLDDLPAEAAVDTLAIVCLNNVYYVYKKTSTGWEAQVK